MVEALFRELAGLGIDGARPGPNDLEEQWLDALADHHGCLGDMNRAVAADINTPRNTCKKAFLGKLLNISEEELRWQIYTCIRAGRIVHNRPHGIGADPAGKFYPGHDIHFAALEPWNSCRFVTGCLGNEAALISFERRSQIGMKPIWDNKKIIAQTTDDYQCVIRHSRFQETRFSNPVSLLDEMHLLEMGFSEGEELLRKLKKRFSHWPDGRPLEQLFPQSWSVLYHELTCEGNQLDQGIKNLIKVCGQKSMQLLFEQNPQLLKSKLVSLDGLKLDGRSYDLSGIDFRGCSMKDTVLQSVSFKKCKFNIGLLGSAIVDNVFFCGCSFGGQRFPSSILDNAHFHPETDQDDLVSESTCELSQILYQSCVNEHNEFNLERWLEVMLKSSLLCSPLTPLDGLSQDILRQHIDEISRTYPQQLCKIIYSLFNINFTNIANAKNFISNNPEFYDRKIKDLKDVYFEFRTIFLKEGNYREQPGNPFEELFFLHRVARRDYSREAVLALMLNVINLVLFPESNDKYIEFGINTNSADGLCLKNIPESSSESTQNNPIFCPETDGLPLDKMRRYRAYLCRYYLEEYRKYIHQFWEKCPKESKLTIAKHCVLQQNVAVAPLTTIAFTNLLAENHGEQNCQDNHIADMCIANIKKHVTSQDDWKLLQDAIF